MARPTFKLYESDGTTLVYEFEKVLDYGDGIFLDPATFGEHTSLRGQGSIVIEGTDAPWDLPLTFYLSGDNYEDLIAKMQSVKTTINRFTKYMLKVELVSGGATKDLKVMRLQPIRYPLTRTRKVVNSQTGIITFRVLTWA